MAVTNPVAESLFCDVAGGDDPLWDHTPSWILQANETISHDTTVRGQRSCTGIRNQKKAIHAQSSSELSCSFTAALMALSTMQHSYICKAYCTCDMQTKQWHSLTKMVSDCPATIASDSNRLRLRFARYDVVVIPGLHENRRFTN